MELEVRVFAALNPGATRVNAEGKTPQSMKSLLDRVEELAPLPHVASRVISVAEDDRFSAYDLSAIVATDTALTAKILRLANSAYYGYPRRITTVRDAVVLIGFRTVRATAIAAAVIDLFPAKALGPFSTDLFRGHSVACALVAEALAKETGHAKPDEAFTAGILHDMGRMVMAQYQPAEFGQALYRALRRQQPLWEAEDEQFGFDHAALGSELARRWNFPGELTAAIAEHHDLQHAPDRSGLTYVLVQANVICHQHGLWCGLDTEDGAKVHPERSEDLEGDPNYASLMRRVGGREEIGARVQEFLRQSQDRDVAWYSPVEALPAAADGEASLEPGTAA